MPGNYVRRDDRKRHIIEKLQGMVKEGKTPEATAYKIARMLDIRPNWNLYSVLADMVADGKLNIRDEVLGNRCTRTFYLLPEGTYTTEHSREIVINGKVWAIQKGF
jgi:hypothetical protein